MRRTVTLLAIATLVLAALPTAAQVTAGRVAGKVVDPEGNPIPGVTVTVTTPDMPSFKLVKRTNRKGRFVVTHTDVNLAYEYTLEKEGYRTLRKPVRPLAGGTVMIKFTMVPESAAESAQSAPGAGAPSAGAAPAPARGAIRIYNEGVEAQQAGDLETAEARYRKALEEDPKLSAAHTSIAAVRFLEGDYAAAAAEAEAALEIDPTDSRALQIRYDAYRKLGDAEKAEEAAKALKALGTATEAAKRVFNEGVDAYRAGDTSAAMSKFLQAVDLDPSLVPAWLALAHLSLKQGSPGRALTTVEQALRRDPENPKALKLKFDAAVAAGNMAAAAGALERLVRLDPEFVASHGLRVATQLYNAGKTDGALSVLRKVLAVKPDHAKAHYLMGLALYNTGDQAGARQHLERFLELAPDDPDAASAREILEFLQ